MTKPILASMLLALQLFCYFGMAQANDEEIRLAVVNTPYKSGLITSLLKDFEASSGYKVSVYAGEDVFDHARQGEADLVIAHYGKAQFQDFVLDGLGHWPEMVFANQQVIIGPTSDPAGIKGMTRASEALKRIAQQGQPFLVNQLPGVSALFSIIWHQAGAFDKNGWLVDKGVAKGKAMHNANQLQAYSLWGAIPFLTFKQKHHPDLDILVSDDPLLQRIMAITLVKGDKQAGINEAGAKKLRDYLLSAPVQARISAFRQPGYDGQLWWPAARHN